MPQILDKEHSEFYIVKDYLEKIKTKLDKAMNFDSKEAIHSIYKYHHQQSKYIFSIYRDKKISTSLYKYLCKYKVVDVELVSYWKKEEYKNLCCLGCISYPFNKCACQGDNICLNGCNICGCKGCSTK